MINYAMTAIARKSASRPTKALVKEGIVVGRVLDYGCGKGADVRFLSALGYNVMGYDPYHNPVEIQGKFDTIICNYVLNVIDDETVRKDVIDNILNLLNEKGCAFVTVRNDVIKNSKKWKPFKDGFLTGNNTFQAQLSVDHLRQLSGKNGINKSCSKYTMLQL